ncbi:ADP-ribosylation factor-like protein 2 [Hypoxylon texense]
MMLTSSTDILPTVTCESGTSADLGYMTVPFAVTEASLRTTINAFLAYAPLFQLVHEISTSASDTSSPTSSAASAPPRQSVPSSQTISPAQASSTSSSQMQGLSAGASAGIGCGVGLGLILLGAVAFCLVRTRRRKARGSDSKKSELPAYAAVAEMRTDMDPVELEAHHGAIQPPYYTQAPRYGFQVRK